MCGDDLSPGSSGLYPKNSTPLYLGKLAFCVDLLLAKVRSDWLGNLCKAYVYIFESSHADGKVKSDVSNVFSHAQPFPHSMYTRNKKQKGLKTRSHWDKKNILQQVRGKEAT